MHPATLATVGLYLAVVALGWWMLRHVVPDRVTLDLLGHAKVVGELHRRIVSRVAEAGVMIPAVFLLEYLWMGWEQSSVRHLLFDRTASAWSDVSCYALMLAPGWALVTGVMSLGLVMFSGECVRSWIQDATGLGFSIAGAPVAIQAALLVLVYTFFDYWGHRLDHTRLLWPLHRFHHSAKSFSVLTAARVHPAMFTAVVSATLPGVLLGADAAVLAHVGIAIMVLRAVIHSRIESDFGWVGRWLIQSPLHHRFHHSLGRAPMNVGLLPAWDRMFGTWRDVRTAPRRIGVATPYRHGLWIGPDVLRDYLEFWRGAGVAMRDLGRLVIEDRPFEWPSLKAPEAAAPEAVKVAPE